MNNTLINDITPHLSEVDRGVETVMKALANLRQVVSRQRFLDFENRVACNVRGRSPLPGAPEHKFPWPEDIDTTDNRCFSSSLFMGNGEHSSACLALLRERLEFAFECLGDIHQSLDPEEMAEIPALEKSIEGVLKDLAHALLEKRVEFHPLDYEPAGV